jgi:AraC family transcriptional regulator
MTMRVPGVLPESEIYFWTATDFARSALTYIKSGGVYYCDPTFAAAPPCTQLYTLIWVKEGELQFQADDREYRMKAGTVFLQDCRQPHSYRVTNRAVFAWIHFDGSLCEAYYRFLEENGKWMVSGRDSLGVIAVVQRLMEGLKTGGIHDHQIAVCLQDIFNKMVLPCEEGQAVGYDAAIEAAIAYIGQHYPEELSLEKIAEQVDLSSFHFARVFKKNTNITPHEYLLNIRIQNAKKMLYDSAQSVEEIAKLCGFNSTSHFIRVFKKYTNITPKQFRQVQF